MGKQGKTERKKSNQFPRPEKNHQIIIIIIIIINK